MAQRPTIIKAGTAGPDTLGCRTFALNDVLDEVREAQEKTRRQIEQMLAGAQGEAENIRESAREQGFRVGYEEGFSVGSQAGRKEAAEAAQSEFTRQHANLAETARQVIAGIEAQRAQWWAAARNDLVDLALAIAGRVAHSVGQREREAVLRNIEEAARIMGRRSDVVITVNPADAETARQFAPTLTETRGQCQHVQIVEDASVAAGGCKVQWGTGMVDATLEKQLDRIREALLPTESDG